MDYQKIKGVIFDLDGTLLDSMHVWEKIDLDFFTKRGLQMPGDYNKAIIAMNFRNTAVYTKNRFGLNESVEDIISEWHKMAQDEYSHNLRLKPGAEKYLCQLVQKNIKIALATGSGRELFEPALKNNGVYEYFNAFVSLNDVKRDKLFPDIYFKAAEKLSVTPENCLVFEDIFIGICSAKKAGMKVIGVYDLYSDEDKDNIKLIADDYIMDFNELTV